MVHRIGLVEALCGFQFTVTHLDGRQLLVKYPPGKVIEPGKHLPFTLIYFFCYDILSFLVGQKEIYWMNTYVLLQVLVLAFIFRTA